MHPPISTYPELALSLGNVLKEYTQVHGPRAAAIWLKQQRAQRVTSASAPKTAPEPSELHESYLQAQKLLEPVREAVGAAYETILALARWSIEHATPQDPAPHMMTTYWTLEELTGKSERTLRRHLVETTHPWSQVVRELIDLRHNYGTMLAGRDEDGRPIERPVITGMIIRFFPHRRRSNEARVKLWGRRDLIADADDGMTRPSRRHSLAGERYQRKTPGMSAYSSLIEQIVTNRWLMVKLGQTVTNRAENKNNHGSLYADIPTNHVLGALRADLDLMLERARERGASIKRARSLWVDTAAQLLALRHNENQPQPYHLSNKHVTRADGFTDFWRRLLWTSVRAELYGGTSIGWSLLQRLVTLAREAREEGKRKPTAWAWSLIKRAGFNELLRDFETGAVGERLSPALPIHE